MLRSGDALLGDRRLRIAPDKEHGFLVEGVVRVGPDILVAGAHYVPVEAADLMLEIELRTL